MSQIEKLKTILEDGEVHTVPELIRRVYGLNKPSSARLAARIHDLRKRGHKILSDEVKGSHTKWWYMMVPKKKIVFKKERKKHD